jgi:hypothetical protein
MSFRIGGTVHGRKLLHHSLGGKGIPEIFPIDFAESFAVRESVQINGPADDLAKVHARRCVISSITLKRRTAPLVIGTTTRSLFLLSSKRPTPRACQCYGDLPNDGRLLVLFYR